MEQKVIKTKEYRLLQEKLKSKTRHLSLHSPEVVKVNQEIDKHILKAMREGFLVKKAIKV